MSKICSVCSSSNYINAKKSVRSSPNRVPLIGLFQNGISRTKSRIKLSVLDQRGILLKNLALSGTVQLMDTYL